MPEEKQVPWWKIKKTNIRPSSHSPRQVSWTQFIRPEPWRKSVPYGRAWWK